MSARGSILRRLRVGHFRGFCELGDGRRKPHLPVLLIKMKGEPIPDAAALREYGNRSEEGRRAAEFDAKKSSSRDNSLATKR
jgi:hypothetical protein